MQSILQAVSSGQVAASGQAVTPKDVQAAPFVVRVKLDDESVAAELPAGSAGDAAIFTDRIQRRAFDPTRCCCVRSRS